MLVMPAWRFLLQYADWVYFSFEVFVRRYVKIFGIHDLETNFLFLDKFQFLQHSLSVLRICNQIYDSEQNFIQKITKLMLELKLRSSNF